MNNGIKDQTVTMAHGAGGRQTSELIDNIFAAHFANPDLTADDAAVLNPPVGKMAVSTDGRNCVSNGKNRQRSRCSHRVR